MKKLSAVLLGLFIMPFAAFADDAPASNQTLKLDVRRIGLELSKTTVSNAREYADSPVSALNASSQDYIKGVLDTVLEYNKNKFKYSII